MGAHVRFVWTACAIVAALSGTAAAEERIVVVRSADAAVISDISEGFRSAFPGATVDELNVADPKVEASVAKKLAGASVVLSIGTKAAGVVAKAKSSAKSIAVVPPAQADPATFGPTMRLQPAIDGVIATIPWMGSRFRRVALVLDAGAIERQKIAEVEAARSSIELTVRTSKDAREVVTAVSELVGKNDLVIVDVSEGLQGNDVQFMLRAAQDAKIPLVGTSEGFVKAGAPAAIAIDPKSVGAEAGKLAKEGAAGMFDPRRFRVLVNVVVMDRLGVSVPLDRGSVDANILTLDTDKDSLASATKAVTVTKPGVQKRGSLKYPEMARRNNIRSGEVVLEVQVKADGSIGNTKVLKGDAMFASAALDSIRTWQFKPATRDGAPVEDTLRLNLKFAQ